MHVQRGDEVAYQWISEWFILQCRGCDYVFVERVSSNSEDIEPAYDEYGRGEGWEHIETKSHWPAIASRKPQDWFFGTSIEADGADDLGTALFEVYGALQNDLHMLAAIGIRTCFDLASVALGANAELSFKAKLKSLKDNGHIAARDIDRLEALVEAGSASVHRGWKPTRNDLEVLMEVLEHFIFEAFVRPYRAKKLDEKAIAMAAGVPKRAFGKSAVPAIGATVEEAPTLAVVTQTPATPST